MEFSIFAKWSNSVFDGATSRTKHEYMCVCRQAVLCVS